MTADMGAHEKLSLVVTELFLRGKESTEFHLFLYHNLLLKSLKL